MTPEKQDIIDRLTILLKSNGANRSPYYGSWVLEQSVIQNKIQELKTNKIK